MSMMLTPGSMQSGRQSAGSMTSLEIASALNHNEWIEMDWVEWLQWPAMAVTLLASWLVASKQEKRRNFGFWAFLVSNGLWVAWGVHDGAIALIALQIGLAFMNIRGAYKTD
jgi:hypothetical protein